MKHKLCLILLSSTMLVGCIKETKTISKEKNSYETPECVYYGTCTTGGSGGGGSNTSGTSGSTGTTGTTDGSSYPWVPSHPVEVNWGVHYPAGVPQGSGTCTTPQLPSGAEYAYDTRKATLTAAGGKGYDPTFHEVPSYYNTSSILKSVESAKQLFGTDSRLSVRFKVHPQPDARQTTDYCYGRTPGLSSMPGYTKLSFTVNAVGTRNGNKVIEPVGTYTVGVNDCSNPINLSSIKSAFPDGVYLTISSVKSNQGEWWDPQVGFQNSNVFTTVPSQNCWAMEIEVSADGTKVFPN
ncbi:MAG TPA: hypothetical protein VKZ84_00935 [Bacteriovoracaceae bacterium]|nr:hypothetical protein [Bacteriovoracaceae bacterium]